MVTPSELRFGKTIHRVTMGDIESLIQNQIDESHNLEYKQPSSSPEKDCNYLAKTISGFLNTDGGILVYGVSEKKEGNHRYANAVEWCDTPKERLEDLLKSKVEPWKETISIKRIDNKENQKEGVFVIEVPKSNSPPHMHNSIYYQRLNFQTEPMSHQNIFRAFQTTWIHRKDLYQNVLEPLYAEIKENCEKIENYRQGSSTKYDNVIHVNRYLYDQIELSLWQKIEDFYRRLKKLNTWLTWIDRIAVRIINEKLSTILHEQRNQTEHYMSRNNLIIKTKVKYPDGRIQEVRVENAVTRALSLGITIASYLQSSYPNEEILEYEPFFHLPPENPVPIPDQTFGELWNYCRSKVAEDEIYISIRKEMPKISMSGYQILRLISGR